MVRQVSEPGSLLQRPARSLCGLGIIPARSVRRTGAPTSISPVKGTSHRDPTGGRPQRLGPTWPLDPGLPEIYEDVGVSPLIWADNPERCNPNGFGDSRMRLLTVDPGEAPTNSHHCRRRTRPPSHRARSFAVALSWWGLLHVPALPRRLTAGLRLSPPSPSPSVT
jgi:hypothetical protein